MRWDPSVPVVLQLEIDEPRHPYGSVKTGNVRLCVHHPNLVIAAYVIHSMSSAFIYDSFMAILLCVRDRSCNENYREWKNGTVGISVILLHDSDLPRNASATDTRQVPEQCSSGGIDRVPTSLFSWDGKEMNKRLSLKVSGLLLAVFLAMSGSAAVSASADAAACKGKTSHEIVSIDYMTGSTYEVTYLNSCKARSLVNAYNNAQSAAGLAGALGSKWWPVGVVSGIVTGWAWHNGAKLKSCAAKGTGIKFNQGLGIVLGCSAQ